MIRIRIYQDRAGEWRWRLKAANGKIVADSSEGYKRRSAADRAVQRLLEMLRDGVSVEVAGPAPIAPGAPVRPAR